MLNNERLSIFVSWRLSAQTILNMPFHMKSANVLESSQYGDEFVGIRYSSKYSKYFEGLPKDMQQFYICCSLPWEYPMDQGLALKL
jgi:hypothetical protein